MKTTFEIQTATDMHDWTTNVALRVCVFGDDGDVVSAQVVRYRESDPKGLVDSLVSLAAAIEKDIK